MKSNQKLFAKVMGIFLSLTMVLLCGQTVLAAAFDDDMDFLSVGAGILFEPKHIDTTEKISEMAQTLNLDLAALQETKEESIPKLAVL